MRSDEGFLIEDLSSLNGTYVNGRRVEGRAPIKDQDRIQEEIHKTLDAYPGLETEVLTFLGDRIGESLSGETAALAVGVYGADLDTLDKTAAQIAAVMEKVPGAVDGNGVTFLITSGATDASFTSRAQAATSP